MTDTDLDAAGLPAPAGSDDGRGQTAGGMLPAVGTALPARHRPNNAEVEQALLGALLINNEATHRVSSFLRPEHFHEPVHQRIYGQILRFMERGQIANPATLKPLFDSDPAPNAVGGASYLARLVGSAISIINVEDYAKIIHDFALRRALIDIGEDVVNEAYDGQAERRAIEQIEHAEHRLYTLAEQGEIEGGFVSFDRALGVALDQIEAAYKRDGNLVGVATDLIDLDNLMGGLQPSDLLILAGRPSMGKTALATTIAFNAARAYRAEPDTAGRAKGVDGAVVGFFSLEMSSEQLAARLLAGAAGVPSDRLRRGTMSAEDFERVVMAARDLSRIPLFIDDTPAITVPAMRARARRLKRQHGLSMIVVDYLQLMRAVRATDNRVQEVSEITQGLKAVAKELNVPVIALSQLSRAVEQREDKRPQLSDLRESGSIEQDADVVMFVFREEYYLARAEPKQRPDEKPDKFAERYSHWQSRFEISRSVAEVIVAKQRHGPIGTVRLHFDLNTTRFGNLDRDHAALLAANAPEE